MATPGLLSRRLLPAACFLYLLAPVSGQDRITELHTQFERENEPVRKAKALTKLGDAQFELLRKETDTGEYTEARRTIQDYRDEVRSTLGALKASGVDAERKPGGFKQLQIHLRKSLRELDQTILTLPADQREPFETIRTELAGMEKELIDLLFPRQPGKTPEKDKKKS